MYGLHVTPLDSPSEPSIVGYADWLKDFERRLSLHDAGVALLARDIATRTRWRVRAGAPGFEPPTRRGDATPDVVCERGADQPPVVFEVELPETLVRRETVRRLAGLVAGAVDARVVLIVDGPDHEGAISDGRRLLRSAGLDIPVAAVSPQADMLTGTDW